MPEIDANGTRLTYVDEGQGAPVVLVHGSLGDYRTWAPQVPFFARHYRVIAYSRRYHYPYPWTGAGPEFSAALHADDLAALIERLDLAPVHLVGSSYGALTSLTCALRHPGLVRSLVLAEPPILPWLAGLPAGKPLFDAFMADAWQPATRAFKDGDLEQGVRAFINGVSGAPVFDRMPDAVRQRQLENARALQAETEANPAAYFSTVACQDAARVAVPALLLRGETSPRMFGLILDELARCLPDCRRAAIPAASHSMASGNPSAYNETVLAFLHSIES